MSARSCALLNDCQYCSSSISEYEYCCIHLFLSHDGSVSNSLNNNVSTSPALILHEFPHPGVLTASVLVALLVSIGTFCMGVIVVFLVRALCGRDKNADPQPALASSSSKPPDPFDSAPYESDTTTKSTALIKPATLRDNFTGARNDLWRLALDPGRSMETAIKLLGINISEPEPRTE